MAEIPRISLLYGIRNLLRIYFSSSVTKQPAGMSPGNIMGADRVVRYLIIMGYCGVDFAHGAKNRKQ